MATAPRKHGASGGLWETPPSANYGYTEDQVIDAYLKGKNEALAGRDRALLRILRENADRCAVRTENVLRSLSEKGFSPDGAFLRINSFDHMDVMVCVPEEDYLEESFLEVYGQVAAIEEAEASGNGLFLEFSFLDFDGEGYSAKMLASDGYILKYGRAHEA